MGCTCSRSNHDNNNNINDIDNNINTDINNIGNSGINSDNIDNSIGGIDDVSKAKSEDNIINDNCHNAVICDTNIDTHSHITHNINDNYKHHHEGEEKEIVVITNINDNDDNDNNDDDKRVEDDSKSMDDDSDDADMEIEFISLHPGFVIKTKRLLDQSKVFVNFFYHEYHPLVQHVVSCPAKWSVDKKGVECEAFDVIVPKSCFVKCAGDDVARKEACEDSIHLVNNRYKECLSLEYSLPNIKKGFVGDDITSLEIPSIQIQAANKQQEYGESKQDKLHKKPSKKILTR